MVRGWSQLVAWVSAVLVSILIVWNAVAQNVFVVFVVLGVELLQAKTVVLVAANVLREVSLVLPNCSIAIEDLVGHELICLSFLTFVNFSFFGHIWYKSPIMRPLNNIKPLRLQIRIFSLFLFHHLPIPITIERRFLNLIICSLGFLNHANLSAGIRLVASLEILLDSSSVGLRRLVRPVFCYLLLLDYSAT